MGLNDWGFRPATTIKASQDIVNQIQASILSGKLKPGDRLPTEREMAAIFNRSRPTVREALRILEKQGLTVVVGGSSGSVVCKPGTTQLEQPLKLMLAMNSISLDELYEARNMVELSIVQWAAERRTDDDLAEMARINALTEEVRDNLERFTELDRDFHEAVARAARNSIAEILIQVLRKTIRNTIANSFLHMSQTRFKEEQDHLLQTHVNLTRVIAAKDPEAAKAYMEEHILQFQRINKSNYIQEAFDG